MPILFEMKKRPADKAKSIAAVSLGNELQFHNASGLT